MKRLILSCILAMAGCFFSYAGDIRSVGIDVVIAPDGSASVTERWDVDADEGTEWYLAKYNLGAIRLTNLSVTDGDGPRFVNEGVGWDSDRPLAGKAGRCGLIATRGGYEICWGLGSYGHHLYTVTYTIEGAVQAMDDYDCFHMQMVSPGLSDSPRSVEVRYRLRDGEDLNPDNCRIWGFGFVGEAVFHDGEALFRSTEQFSLNSSVISLIRFNKGLLSPTVNRGGSFETVLDRALEGSSYEDEVPLSAVLLVILFFVALFVLCVVAAVRLNNRRVLGVPSKKDIDWSRDVPYGGDVLAANHVLSELAPARDGNVIAGAMILRMIESGAVLVQKSSRGKVELAFGDESVLGGLPASYSKLWQMMKEASGKDNILQDKEFSSWSSAHTKQVDSWCKAVKRDETSALRSKNLMGARGTFNDDAKAQARMLVGLKKFLKDFTLVNERSTAEVGLWNDYLVFASLFGIADKVAKELRDINPEVFAETVYMDPGTARSIIYMTRSLGYSITNASAAQQAKAAQAGKGGFTSFGGGRGFSGGGFGGGAR